MTTTNHPVDSITHACCQGIGRHTHCCGDAPPEWSDFGLRCFSAAGRTFVVDAEQPYTGDIQADALMSFDERDTAADDLRRLLSVVRERITA
jgi:hypothetical protein